TPVHVTGLLGGWVSLPCHMTADQLDRGRHSQYPAVSMRWRRTDGDHRPVVSVSPSGLTHTSRSAASRASVRKSHFELGNFSLHLVSLGVKDAGTYEGQAQYGDIMAQCTVILSITHVTESPVGIHPENGSVNLTCSRFGSSLPDRSIRWLHNGAPVRPSDRLRLSGATLHLQRLTQADRGEWSCEEGEVRATHTLRVLGISGPASLSVYAAVGSHAELPCSLSETPPEGPLRVRWIRSWGPVEKPLYPQGGVRGEALVISPVSSDDAGTYRCDVTYKEHTITRHVRLKVIQVTPPSPGFVREGSPLRLLCNVSGSEGGEKFEWTGPPSGENGVREGAALELPEVWTQAAGAWNCSIYGKEGILGTAQYLLYVHAPQSAEVNTLSSWQPYLILLLALLLVMGLVTVAAVSLRNRRRRLSHLVALAPSEVPSASLPKLV
ncbi:hypothetical protein FKM82_022792, partial [Ascaphus truei]